MHASVPSFATRNDSFIEHQSMWDAIASSDEKGSTTLCSGTSVAKLFLEHSQKWLSLVRLQSGPATGMADQTITRFARNNMDVHVRHNLAGLPSVIYQ